MKATGSRESEISNCWLKSDKGSDFCFGIAKLFASRGQQELLKEICAAQISLLFKMYFYLLYVCCKNNQVHLKGAIL